MLYYLNASFPDIGSFFKKCHLNRKYLLFDELYLYYKYALVRTKV